MEDVWAWAGTNLPWEYQYWGPGIVWASYLRYSTDLEKHRWMLTGPIMSMSLSFSPLTFYCMITYCQGQPNNGRLQNCLGLAPSTGFWDDGKCDGHYIQYICERKSRWSTFISYGNRIEELIGFYKTSHISYKIITNAIIV